ncbi:MAG: RDD family protein [Thermoplasmata archaeon]
MVDPIALTNDIGQTLIYLALLPALWLFLYLLIWERPVFARQAGLTRTIFWLLLPASFFGLIANLPFLPVGADILGINLAGGVIPLVLAALLLRRFYGAKNVVPWTFYLAFGAESGILLALVLFVSSATVQSLAVIAVAAVAVALVGILESRSPRPPEGARRLPTTLALGFTSAALVATFLTTAAQPGVGIVSYFPFYLLIPLLAGGMAVLVLRETSGPRSGIAGLPLAYASATFGVLIGADLLRQPPLYLSGPSGFYVIGGAGVMDLLYLTGLLALVGAYGMERALTPATSPVGSFGELPRTPNGRLREAFDLGVQGDVTEAIEAADRASQDAAAVGRRLLGRGDVVPQAGPWDGLGLPSWISADQTNLDALARAKPDNPREAFRAWTTARWLVRIGQDVGRRRFGSPLARVVAFLIDLLLVTAPAAVIWLYLALTIPGTVVDILSNTVFGAVALGFAAWAFLYFVIAEGWFGTTVGKSLVHLSVRNRALGEPTITAVLVRDAPKLLPLSIIGVGGAIGVILLFRGADVSVTVGGQGVVLAGDPFAFLTVLGFIIITVGLCGLVGWILMIVSNESQRFGDLLAGTWVVRDAIPVAAAESLPPPPVPAAEGGRSG